MSEPSYLQRAAIMFKQLFIDSEPDMERETINIATRPPVPLLEWASRRLQSL